MKIGLFSAGLILALFIFPLFGQPNSVFAVESGKETTIHQVGDKMDAKKLGPFARGEINPYGKYFQGQSYLNMLARGDMPIANVTFEPACRNNWHVHHADKDGGQILLCTYGRGWYQEWGKPARELHEGDVVVIPHGVKHWHGAAKDSWFEHISVEVPGVNTRTEWLEPVSKDDYDKLP